MEAGIQPPDGFKGTPPEKRRRLNDEIAVMQQAVVVERLDMSAAPSKPSVAWMPASTGRWTMTCG